MAPKLRGRLTIVDWTALVIVAPIMIGGMLASAFVQPGPAVRGPRGLRPRRSLSSLRTALLGRHKSAVAKALGPPRTATVGSPLAVGAAASEPPSFLVADTWYYALDARDRSAMAIQFEADRAREVEFFHSGVE